MQAMVQGEAFLQRSYWEDWRFGSWLAAVLVVIAMPAAAQEDEAAAAVTEAAASVLRPFALTAFADLAEGYSSNAGGGEGDDSFSRGRVGFDLDYRRPRLQADASYVLTGQYWSRLHRFNHLSHRLNLTSRTVVVPDMLLVNANAFAAPAELTRVGQLSAGGEPLSRYNSRDTFGYSLTPQVSLRFQDYVNSNFSAAHGGVFFVKPSSGDSGTPPPVQPAENSLSTTISEQLSSGSWFGRLFWSASGSYGQYSQTSRTQRQVEGLGNLTYALSRQWKVFAIGGYSDYHSTAALNRDLSGPTAMGGVTFNEGAAFQLTVQAGSQHNMASYTGSLSWELSPLTAVIGEVTDGISTPQGDILGRLSGMNGYGGGSYSSNGSGLGSSGLSGYSPLPPGGLSLDNNIYRMRRAEFSAVHTDDRMRYTVSLFGTERDRLDGAPAAGISPRSSSYGISASALRNLNARMTAMVGFSWSRGNEFGGHDNIVSADAQVTYRLSQHIDFYLTNHFLHRASAKLVDVPNGPQTEDQVILGIRARL